jgi:methionyl aminopeptidase
MQQDKAYEANSLHRGFLSSEPMLTLGSINPVMWPDDWTAVTEDGSLSAQFEHTILITEDGPEILTVC